MFIITFKIYNICLKHIYSITIKFINW